MTDVTLSDSAVKRIGEILKTEPDGAMLRVSVEGGGCSGFQYKFDIERAKADDDLVLARGAAVVLIDPVSVNYMAGSQIDFVARLAQWDILYDRDGDGEYLQLNSRAFDKRFYFEVVERRGGYDQYGAANEVIKLTTQSRFKNDQLNAL